MSFQLNFQLKGEGGDLGTYVTNGEWDLLGRSGNEEHNSVCVNFLHLNFLSISIPLHIFTSLDEWT